MDIADTEEELLGLFIRNRKRRNMFIQTQLSEPSSSSKILRSQGILLSGLYLRDSRPQQDGFMELMEKKSDLEFFILCRVTRKTFNMLHEMLTSHNEFKVKHSGGTPRVGVDVSLMITLWYLGSQCTYSDICEKFGISISCAHNLIDKVIYVINMVYEHVIEWPSAEQVSKVEEEFRMLCDFPGAIAAIDECHIKIRAPEHRHKEFIDRTKIPSINLFAACDANGKFLYVNAEIPGSAYGQQVLDNTSLGIQLENDYKSLCYEENFHIIGNSSYLLKPYLMVPYTGDLNAKKIIYNNKLSMTHSVIESSFAWLKGRFGRLKFIGSDLSRITSIVNAACILHNITIDFEEERKLLLNNMEINIEKSVKVMAKNVSISTKGLKKRNKIMQSL